ncbi:MAG TPA: DUF86 domain-containing protein [Halanaerobiales bacterium]|nr:DUF86 domain-containing protein [Halanaerobiales bacterium]
MVNREVVLDRISIIKNSLKRLKEISKLSKQEFKNNDDYFAIAEHHLRRSLEAVIDLGRHICVKEDLGQPQDYTEVFDILNNGGVLSKEFTENIRGMAGYRNRLVHMYNQIDKEEIYQILQERLDDFDIFTNEIMNYINKN